MIHQETSTTEYTTDSTTAAETTSIPTPAPRQAKDCWDLYTTGVTTSGIYTIDVSGRDQPLEVYCDMDDGGGWTMIQRRKDGSQDFYLYWADYKVGFGTLSGEFWLGNDAIHLLTNQDMYQLTVKLTKWDGEIKYANYKQFNVANETNLYRLSVDYFNGTSGIGDSLFITHNGMAWSTRDQENDLDGPRNCATHYNAAWWYNNCERSNLNGPYVQYPGQTSIAGKGIMWGTWMLQMYSFPRAEMKIRPTTVGFEV